MNLSKRVLTEGPFFIFLNGDINVATVHSGSCTDLPQENTDRLAAMFVAAPDMLEALKNAVAYLTNEDGETTNSKARIKEAVKEMRAAIAKAEPTTTTEQ